MGNHRRLAVLCLAVTALGLNACAETSPVAYSGPGVTATGAPIRGHVTYKVGSPYEVKGVWYYPREDYNYHKTGIASWYGPGFHGKYTADGEVYDMNALTAANKTLPLPSIVRVTNLESGRSIVVRVNDRGPFVNGRIIDLSRRAAQLLGMEQAGTARVRVDILAGPSMALKEQLLNQVAGNQSVGPHVTPQPRMQVASETLAPPIGARVAPPRHIRRPVAPPPRATPVALTEEAPTDQSLRIMPVHATHLFVQAGAFTRYDYARRLSERLSSFGAASIHSATVNGTRFYRVRFGPLRNVSQADGLLNRMIDAGYTNAKIVID